MGRTDLHYLHVGRDITGGPSVVPLAAHAHGTSSEWRAYRGRETETRDSRCHAVDGSRHRHQGAGFRLLSKSGESLLMAKSRHPAAQYRLLLLPQHQTFRGPRWTSGFDPQRKLKPCQFGSPCLRRASIPPSSFSLFDWISCRTPGVKFREVEDIFIPPGDGFGAGIR